VISSVNSALSIALHRGIQTRFRVEVCDSEVVLRSFSFPFRRRRIPRSTILGVGLFGPTINPGRRSVEHLGMFTSSGTEHLPAPVTAAMIGCDDPDFFRIWHWLDHELCSDHRSVDTETHPTFGEATAQGSPV